MSGQPQPKNPKWKPRWARSRGGRTARSTHKGTGKGCRGNAAMLLVLGLVVCAAAWAIAH